MRDIKFRGFHACDDGDTTIYVGGKAVKGRWVYGSLYQDYDMPENASIIPIGCLEWRSGNHFTVEAYDVLPATIGQFLNRTDKDGAQLWEHDTARDTITGDVYALEWIDKYERFDWVKPGVVFAVMSKDRTERIGTIFDAEDKEAESGD